MGQGEYQRTHLSPTLTMTVSLANTQRQRSDPNTSPGYSLNRLQPTAGRAYPNTFPALT
jgi:hypothetical protein